MFVGMGISAVFPVLDGLMTFGFNAMEKQIGLSWLVLQGALYILGAGLYAVSQHQQLHRTVLTHLGSYSGSLVSRKVRHLGQFPSDLPCAYRLGCLFAFEGLAESL